jgi:hypothetical protein
MLEIQDDVLRRAEVRVLVGRRWRWASGLGFEEAATDRDDRKREYENAGGEQT